jgi:hypothetical protein
MTDQVIPATGAATAGWLRTVTIGVAAGLFGGAFTWVYEIIVWVGLQHLMPLAQIPSNGTGLVFGPAFRDGIGWPAAALLGAVIHFGFSALWGVLFAVIWPYFRARSIEATLVALFYAVFAWIVMHLAIVIAGHPHPNYADPNVILSGFMSHFFFTVPLALAVKRLSSNRPD